MSSEGQRRNHRLLEHEEDITERKHAQDALKHAHQRFAIAADAAGIGFWDWDIKANTLRWDDWMFRLYGRPALDGHHPYELWATSLHPDDKARSERELFEAIEGKRPFDTEFRVIHPDGQIRHLKAVASVTRDANGNAAQYSASTSTSQIASKRIFS